MRLFIPSRRRNIRAGVATFDGTTNYLQKYSSAAVNGGLITLSVYLKPSDISGNRVLYESRSQYGWYSSYIYLQDGQLFIKGKTASNTVNLDANSSGIVFANNTAALLQIRINLVSSSLRGVYINNSEITMSWNTYKSFALADDNAGVTIGAGVAGGGKYAGDMAAFWMSGAQDVDFTIEANRQDFFDDNYLPISVGVDGSLPTGSAPEIYLGKSAIDFGVNTGTGGNFNVVGTLAAGSY